MKIFQIFSTVFITAVLFPAVHSRPSVSRLNDGNGQHGYQYEVAHPAGSSRVHMNTGATSNNHQPPSYLNKSPRKHHADEYISYPSRSYEPPGKNYPPHSYANQQNDYRNSPYASEEIYEPQPSYPSPYDSEGRNVPIQNEHYSGVPVPQISKINRPSNTAYSSPIPEVRNTDLSYPSSQQLDNDLFVSQEFTNPPITHEPINHPTVQEYINPPIVQEHINPTTPEEHINLPVTQEHISPLVTQEHINPSFNQEHISAPIIQQNTNPHLSQEHVNPSISQEYINPPLVQKTIKPPVAEVYINTPVAQEYINPPIAQKQHIDPPIAQEHINPPLVQEYINPPVAQEHINPPITQEYINPPVVQEHINPSSRDFPSEILSSQVSESALGFPKGNSVIGKTVPTGNKYLFVPSGPPHVTDTHTTHIIHPPLPNNQGHAFSNSPKVASDYSAPSPSLITHEVNPAPISHAFRLPDPSNTPSHFPSFPGSHDEASPPLLIDNSHPAAPISHSTRLLVSGHDVPGNLGVTNLSPIAESNVHHHDDVHTSPELPPTSHAIRLRFPPATFSAPLSDPESLAVDPALPPISHAFRLNLPLSPVRAIESNDHPSNLNVPATPEVRSPGQGASHAPRLSHAFRLSLPSVPVEKPKPVPQVEYISAPGIEHSSNSDVPLLALESKSDQ